MLHKTAQIGDRGVCELLIHHGADVNKQDAKKQTSLWVAAEEGHEGICEVLIQNGASVNESDAAKRSPLWIAARKKHFDVCKILIDNGARLYQEDELGICVLMACDDIPMLKQMLYWHNEYSKMFSLFTLFPR